MSARGGRVTVVIPVWGAYAGARLDVCLESLRGQEDLASILLVDNVSEPPLARDDVRVVRTGRRLPLGAVRNAGLDAVRTPFVVFWDADDAMPAGTLALLVRELDADPGVVAASARMLDTITGEPHHWPRRWPVALVRSPRAFALVNAVTSLYGVTGAVIRTEVAREARFPLVGGGDDWVLGVSLAFRGRVVLRPETGRVYHRHTSSVSAGWGTLEARAHAKLVRDRLRSDPAVPRAVRLLVPVVWLAQQVVLGILRPVARRTPRRRREGT